MNIQLKKNYGYELIIEADNVKIHEDIESRMYPKDENGKSIINLNVLPTRDIKDENMDMFSNVLQDMAYYREANYDSCGLIEQLFDKLSDENKQAIHKYVNDNI